MVVESPTFYPSEIRARRSLAPPFMVRMRSEFRLGRSQPEELLSAVGCGQRDARRTIIALCRVGQRFPENGRSKIGRPKDRVAPVGNRAKAQNEVAGLVLEPRHDPEHARGAVRVGAAKELLQ